MPAKNRKPRFRNVIKWIIFTTNIIAIILLYCSFLSWSISPLTTNLFSYIGQGFGFNLLINITYVIFWALFSKWGLSFVSLLAIVLCYKPVTTFFPLHINPPKPVENNIKILTYNVQGFPAERDITASEHPIL